MGTEFEVIKLMPTEQILAPKGFVGQLKPTKLYVLPHGTITNKPAYAFLMEDAMGGSYIAQISHAMLKDGMVVAEGMTSGNIKQKD